ncbi:MAG: ADP-ribosylglycohydrolase family protein [Phycisphaerae bacterium]
MRWSARQIDVLEQPADVLICSANVGLNLSGGVGGAILQRHGGAMQAELHGYLKQHGIRHVQPGDVVRASPCGTHFQFVLHAVAIDGFYESSPELVRSTVRKALEMAAAEGARAVALTALATGYGPFTIPEFAAAIRPLMSLNLPPIDEVVICVLKDYEVDQLDAVLREGESPGRSAKESPIDVTDRLKGLLIGTAVGDAIGLPRESMSKRRAVRLFGSPPLGHRLIIGRGMFSDDTEHACMTAEAFLADWNDPKRFAGSLAWRLRGWFLSLSPGIGMATAEACIKLLLGWPASRSGVFSAGNGPAMRAPIIGALLADRPELMREMVRASTRLTHTDPKAEEGAWVVAMAAAYAVKRTAAEVNADEFIQSVLPSLKGDQLKQFLTLAMDCLKRDASASEFAETIGQSKGISGYINHTVPAVIFCWLRYRGDFRRTVEETVLLGGDADTTGAIVGALAGATVGEAGIPEEWVRGLWEWPRSVGWIRRLARRVSERVQNWDSPRRIRPPWTFWPGVLLRNLLLFLIVLGHGLRRIFPPY